MAQTKLRRISRRERERKFASMMPIVRRTAAQYARKVPRAMRDQSDLEQAGAQGLWEATLRLDPRQEAAFCGFAAQRVRGAVLDELRRIDPLTRDQRKQLRDTRAAEQRIEATTGRAATEEEIAGKLGVSVDSHRARLQTFAAARPVVARVIDDGPAFEPVAATAEADPEQLASQGEERARVAEAFATLPVRLQAVLSLYYVQERTLREIGAELGVTESRVCQLHGEAIAKMRGELLAS
ncbi:MAG: sigma-70 family RNA polymerase sigma factor [Myxococcota bacterium]